MPRSTPARCRRPGSTSRRGPRRGTLAELYTLSAVNDFKPGLEGVVAVQTEIAEPDREGGSLRYRGINIEELVGRYPYEHVWGLLVDDDIELRDARPRAVRAGRAERQRALGPSERDRPALRRLGTREAERGLRRAGARGPRPPLGADDVDRRPLCTRSRRPSGAGPGRGRGAGRDRRREVPPALARRGGPARTSKAIDTYWICTAEHGLNASTFTARIVASTGADCGAALSAAVGALSGPLHGGAPAYVKPMLEEVAAMGDPERWVREAARERQADHGLRPPDLPRRGSASRILKRTAKELGSPQVEVAEELEQAALKALQERHPERVARDERRVLLGGRARRGRDPAAARAGDVRLLARRRLVGTHPRAEAHRPALPPVRDATSAPDHARSPSV